MPNPWDIPPFPARGDDEEDITCAGIGRVTSRFEEIEVELSQIYSLFVDRHEDIGAMREYVSPRIFEERIKGLIKGACAYFQRNPNQEAEAELERIVDVARKYAARRNDIAHGIVRPFRWIILPSVETDPYERMQFCVVPPHYEGKKFDPKNMPIYVYARREMEALNTTMFHFLQDITKFKWRLMMDC